MTFDREFQAPQTYAVGDRVRITLTLEVVTEGEVTSVTEDGMPANVQTDNIDPDADMTIVGLVVHGRADT